MRACHPIDEGYVERNGVRTYYEVFGEGDPKVLLMPTWSIVHSRLWKAQVPYLSRYGRVVTFDGRGNGRSDRPAGPEHYSDIEYVEDAIAVLDATGTERAIVVGASLAGWWVPLLAAEHPERVIGIVLIGPVCPLVSPISQAFHEPLDTYEDWAKFNQHYWLQDYRGFVEFFFSHFFPEPHSTKQLEDAVGWAMETTPETLIDTVLAPSRHWDKAEDVYARVQCPVLVIHGTRDGIVPQEHGDLVAEALGAPKLSIDGGGHAPEARDPVEFNLALRGFVKSIVPQRPRRTWIRAFSRQRKALYISSPIGLGHARRDIAIAQEIRRLHPDLRIEWLTQNPVTSLLESKGEHIHPASALLASESGHFESESREHDLHCFQAYRHMDEIMVANFMIFHDVVTAEHFDLVIGDEAWDVDYFLHENPELKRFEFCWLTDFVGWLPMPDGGEREAFLAADYNAEMIEHVARFPRLRGRSIFVGNPDDLVPDRLGPGLPTVREWTEANFDFAGYVTGFDPAEFADREALRAELGYRPDEKVCLVTVGGTGVGIHLLRRVIAACPEAKRKVAGLRMVVVAGPRIDPSSLPRQEGLQVRSFVPELYRHLAACDIAVVQGGLTTTMELAAARRPFIYFPLGHHFEQQYHVRHRLGRYRAGRCMDYANSTPEVIADAIAEEIGRTIDYRPVVSDGAARAAALIAECL